MFDWFHDADLVVLRYSAGIHATKGSIATLSRADPGVRPGVGPRRTGYPRRSRRKRRPIIDCAKPQGSVSRSTASHSTCRGAGVKAVPYRILLRAVLLCTTNLRRHVL